MAFGTEDGLAFDNEAEVSPLAFAARAGDLAEVQRLLQADADPNVADTVGETPLFEAAANGNVSVAVALLLAGADPEWQSALGGVPGDLADEVGMVALLKVCCGEAITEDEQDDIFAAVEPSLRQPVLSFVRSLTGDEEDEDMMRREEEEWLYRSRPAAQAPEKAAPRSRSRGAAPSQRRGARPEEVEVIVTHAIQDGSMVLRVSSDSTFGDVKKAILSMLPSGNGKPGANIYLVKKDRDSYHAYKDRDPIGDVREVRMVGASLPSAAGVRA